MRLFTILFLNGLKALLSKLLSHIDKGERFEFITKTLHGDKFCAYLVFTPMWRNGIPASLPQG
jgi:hypothetical protein